MQSFNFEFAVPMVMSTSKQLASADPVRAAVGHLLSRAPSLPCSTAAQAFSQLVQPTSRFQLALDALLPDLTSSEEVSDLFVVLMSDTYRWFSVPFI
jgi:hypothetical protein